MSEKHVFSRAFITNWDFVCRAVRGVAGGCDDTAGKLTQRLTAKQSRFKELEATVRERVSKRKIVGLLTMVNELLTLKPDRPNVLRLQSQLEKREAQHDARNQHIISRAQFQIQHRQFVAAIQMLNSIPSEYQTSSTVALSQTAATEKAATEKAATEKAAGNASYRKSAVDRAAAEKDELEALRRQLALEARKPQCPHCGGPSEKGFDRCKNCGQEVVWIGHFVGKPGQEGQLELAMKDYTVSECVQALVQSKANERGS
jgi:hypothetical protein